MADILSSTQFRMAKAALKLSNPQISESTGLHRNTLNGVDSGRGSESTLKYLRAFFESNGIEFINKSDGRVGVIYWETDLIEAFDLELVS